ncbi:uncharacterized protein LOC134254658 isoform X2 [Saccostrea cucullata]|uniref:uncharacterized protein LOC134254658 isoform X2 n=1 Tax=Saccostrea cuccullata TaxID=36930 RepID=UPI002ED0B81E
MLFKEKWNPLPPGWDNLLKHYQNLKENNNEESKNALESWMLETDFVPAIILHASINGKSLTDSLEAFENVLKRWKDTCGILEPTRVTAFSFFTNDDKKTLFSSSSKSATIERAVLQQNVVSDKTDSMLRVPSIKESDKSESHVIQWEENARQRQSFARPNPDTDVTHAVKDTEDFKSNKGTAEHLQQNPDLFEHVQNNTFIFEKTKSKGDDNQQFPRTHFLTENKLSEKVRTPNQMQMKRRLPDGDQLLNNSKVPRNIHLEKTTAEQLTNDVQRNNNAEQSPTITSDSDKNQSSNENSLDCQSSPVHTVLNDQDKSFLEEDVFDDFLINNLYQTFLVPDFLRKYLSELKLGTVQPLADVTELCQRILNIHTC